MNRYAKYFGKEVKIEKTIQLSKQLHDFKEQIFEFLINLGYRNVSETDDVIIGVRGLKFWTLFNIGDPRRNYHNISINVLRDTLRVVINMDSWYGLGTEHDISVFISEIEMLKNFLETEHLDYSPLNKAQKKRRRSDWITFFIILCVGVICAIILLSIVICTDNL